MSNLTVNYTGEGVITGSLVETPSQAAHHLMNGYLPTNLADLSTNPNFRDVVIGLLLRDTTDHDTLLNVLCSALRSTESEPYVRCYSEYVAAIAYSWEHTKLAMDAISRNKPTNASTFIWGVAQAMHKQMPGPFYQTLLVSQLPTSTAAYEASK